MESGKAIWNDLLMVSNRYYTMRRVCLILGWRICNRWILSVLSAMLEATGFALPFVVWVHAFRFCGGRGVMRPRGRNVANSFVGDSPAI